MSTALTETGESREQIAAEVRRELDRIGAADPEGLIQPEAVVEAAKDPASPLHRHFEWNVDKAAHAHWLARARHLIARYTVTRIDEGPRYVNVKLGSGRQGYVTTERAVADPDLYQQVVADTEKIILACRNRLSAFGRARPAVEALDEAVEHMRATTPERRSRNAGKKSIPEPRKAA